MPTTKTLERIARQVLPAPAARLAKRLAVGPRSRRQARACREGFERHGDLYPQKVLFIAGLPKSGTTWLERMISSYPGFHDYLPPEVAGHELATGGSHDYELPDDLFSRFRDMLVLTKMHVHASAHNLEVLRQAEVNHVVLFRDLRDVAVSHYFYVRRTPWHPEYPVYRPLDVEQAMLEYARRTLPAYEQWVRGWHERRDPERGIEVRYERMLEDAAVEMTRVAKHFELDSSPETIARIVDAHSFSRLSEGRDRGQQSTSSFYRKGVAGDWKNHFGPSAVDAFKDVIGRFLVDFGYEQDLSW